MIDEGTLRYILVDKILKLENLKYALAVKHVSAHEDYFLDHFPGYPVVPGVLLVEMIGQTAEKCLIAGMGRTKKPILLRINSATFRRPVHPNSSLRIEAFVESLSTHTSKVRGTVSVDGQLAAEASILFGFIPWSHLSPSYEDRVLTEYLKENRPTNGAGPV